MIKPKIDEEIRIVGADLLPMLTGKVTQTIETYPCDGTLPLLSITIQLLEPDRMRGEATGNKALIVVEGQAMI